MRMWAKSTSRAALVAAGALAMGAAFGSTANAGAFTGGGYDHDGKVTMTSSDNFGVLNGTQVYAPISIPIDVCGNAIAVAGLSRAQCEGGAKVSSHRDGHAAHHGYRTPGAWDDGGYGGHGGHGKDVEMTSSGNFGVLNGTQVYAPISVPVNVCGNSVAALGLAQAQCKGGAAVKRSTDRKVDMTSSGNFGILNGTQAYLPISIPVNVCGNAVGVLGLAQAQCKGGATVGDDGHHDMPPTLRTPKHKKPYKPSKHRPAAKHTKLPSTLRVDGHRVADTGSKYRKADGMPAVQGLLDRVKKAVKLPKVAGVDVQPGQIGPQQGAGVPAQIGSPLT